MGVSSVGELRQILGTDVDGIQRKKEKTRTIECEDEKTKDQKDDIVPADEIVYKDSSTFLKVCYELSWLGQYVYVKLNTEGGNFNLNMKIYTCYLLYVPGYTIIKSSQ